MWAWDACLGGGQPPGAAEPWRRDRRERCPRCPLALPPAPPRLLAWGRYARARRQRRGQGQPATCDCLGLPPMGGPTKRGKLTDRCYTIAPRLRQKRQAVQQPLRARRPWLSEQLGAWRNRVVREPYRSSGGPRTRGRRGVVRARIRRDWGRSLRRRRQRHRRPWQRRYRLATPGLPAPSMRPPSPAPRLRGTTRGTSPVRSCRTPGAVRGARKLASLPRPSRLTVVSNHSQS